MGTVLAILGLMASSPAVSGFIVKLLPTLLKIARLVQSQMLKEQALERLQHDLDALVDAFVSDADRAAGNVTDSVGSVASDPGNRDRQ